MSKNLQRRLEMRNHRFGAWSGKFFVFFSMIALVALSISPALAGGAGVPVVRVAVKGSLPQALSHLNKIVAGKGMMVMGELHQGKVMSMTGLSLKSETVFVGNPTVGKKLFSTDPGVGLVVPIRINLYVDHAGRTMLSYIPPSHQLASFHNKKINMVGSKLDKKIGMMVKMLTK